MSVEPELVSVVDIPSTDAKEPAMSTGTIVAGGTLLVNGLVLFGVPLDADQKLYLIAAISFLAPLVAGLVIRFKVFSPASVDQMLQAANLEKAAVERTAQAATAEAIAARTAATAVQQSIPTVVQGLLAQMPQRAPEPVQERPAPQAYPDAPRPPSNRVYGLSQPAARPEPAPVEPTGAYEYEDEERPAPRGFRARHSLRPR